MVKFLYMSKSVKLKTSDGIEISGDFWPAGANAPAGILLHMMPSTKDSWKDFAKKLNNEGFQCLAIDLKGHGESTDGPDGFRDFTDKQHQQSIRDVEAAVEFFVSKGIPMDKIFLAGASIGANLALQYQSEHPEIKASILLSPGLNYRSIETEPAVKKLQKNQSLFLSAGGENDDYSAETARKLFEIAKVDNKELKVFQKAGHGTSIFTEEPGLMDEIIAWLKKIYD